MTGLAACFLASFVCGLKLFAVTVESCWCVGFSIETHSSVVLLKYKTLLTGDEPFPHLRLHTILHAPRGNQIRGSLADESSIHD